MKIEIPEIAQSMGAETPCQRNHLNSYILVEIHNKEFVRKRKIVK